MYRITEAVTVGIMKGCLHARVVQQRLKNESQSKSTNTRCSIVSSCSRMIVLAYHHIQLGIVGLAEHTASYFLIALSPLNDEVMTRGQAQKRADTSRAISLLNPPMWM